MVNKNILYFEEILNENAYEASSSLRMQSSVRMDWLKQNKTKKRKILSMTTAFEGVIEFRFDRGRKKQQQKDKNREKQNENCRVDRIVLNARLD